MIHKIMIHTTRIFKQSVMTALLALAANGAVAQTKIAVISDVHIMDPALLKQEGEAFAEYIRNDRKMLKLGPSLLANATKRILKDKPQVVLVTGDLTKDGETTSHTFLRDNYLKRLKDAGIKVLVIPGNHDVDNPHAVEFNGDKTSRVATPKADEFARIYADYGYGDALARDPYSLSYVQQLDSNTRIICLDACEYYDNDYAKDICVTKGHLKGETLSFIKQQCAEAKAKGMRMIAMMHHGLVEHWKWQDKAMSEYVVDDWRKMARFFEKQGIRICFTGHFHSQDISCHGNVYDVETGSLVSYPSPIRFVTLTPDKAIIRTEQVDANGIDIPDRQSISDYGKYFATQIIHTYVGNMLPKDASAELKKEICDVVAKAYIANLAGDEQMPQAEKANVKAVARDIKKNISWKWSYIFAHIVNFLWNDEAPEDNNTVVNLR